MHKIGIIALDLDGTLLDSEKNVSSVNRAALERAASAGIQIVPTTGRFFGGMPQEIRTLPFVRYAITINGAQVADTSTGEVIYKAELPWQQAVEIMEYLDSLPVIYDCYQNNCGWMTAAQKERIDEFAPNEHYRKMLHELRKPVPELKAFLAQKQEGVQKVQFFTKDMELHARMLKELPLRFADLAVSSSVSNNIEINQSHANKGEALRALARYLGLPEDATLSFGDGLNDISMLREAGVGVAMANACPQAKEAADWVTLSNDENGVAVGIETFCFGLEAGAY